MVDPSGTGSGVGTGIGTAFTSNSEPTHYHTMAADTFCFNQLTTADT